MTRSADDVFNVVPRRALPPVVLVWAGCTGIGATSGADGAFGALAGGGLATVFLASTFLLLRVVKHVEPGLSLALALMVYLFKVTVLATAVLVLRDLPALDGAAAAVSAAVCTVAWSAAACVAFRRLRLPVFELGHGRPGAGS
ncbi:hypothetical protein MN205_12460 [Kineococcus sp. TRM81007]|uniref:hypothetical protein n=1 Tax=Kineococcus sp. TRM81007 TaxID=2925831 RepID=UPI001F586608|nr:hypothetical protein [Kineococcus sp. TRM81007]MCI2239300.1 hypothetical protein [Kineococcus sp. TRM81007]